MPTFPPAFAKLTKRFGWESFCWKTFLKGLLIKPLKGQEKVWKLFWLYVMAIVICLHVLYMALLTSFPNSHGAVLIFAFLCLPVHIWLLFSFWQCAFNHKKDKFYGYLVRSAVVLGTLLLGVQYTLNITIYLNA